MLPLTKFGRLLMDAMMVCVVADTQFVGKDGTLRTYGLNAFLHAHFWIALICDLILTPYPKSIP